MHTYGTAQFKLQARVFLARVFLARVHFAARHEYFSKSCVRVGNCTEMLPAIHTLVPFPFCTRSKMRAYVHALVPFPFCTHSFRSLFTCVQNVDALLHVIIPKLTHETTATCTNWSHAYVVNMGRLTIHERLRVITLFSCGHSVSSIRERLAEENVSISLKGLYIYNLLKKYRR